MIQQITPVRDDLPLDPFPFPICMPDYVQDLTAWKTSLGFPPPPPPCLVPAGFSLQMKVKVQRLVLFDV